EQAHGAVQAHGVEQLGGRAAGLGRRRRAASRRGSTRGDPTPEERGRDGGESSHLLNLKSGREFRASPWPARPWPAAPSPAIASSSASARAARRMSTAPTPPSAVPVRSRYYARGSRATPLP